MNAFSFNQRLSARILAAIALFSLVASMVPVQAFAGNAAVIPSGVVDKNTQIDLCHNNQGESDYSLVQAKAEAIVTESNSGHPPTETNGKTHGEDIIPPFDYDFGEGVKHFGGRNWGTGESLFRDDCKSPKSVNLSVTKLANDTTPDEGQTVTYTITVTNTGPDEASDVTLTDEIPAGTTFISSNPAPKTTNPYTWDLKKIKKNESAVVTVTVAVDSGTSGDTITNTASVTSKETDSNTQNNQVDEDILVNVLLCTNQAANNVGQPLPCTYTDMCPLVDGNQADTALCPPVDMCPLVDGNQADTALCPPTNPQLCTVTIVSDTSDFVVEKNANALALTEIPYTHSGWTAIIGGATWIWGDKPVTNTLVDETQTFKKQFGFIGTVTSAKLYVASDNSHVATLNGDAAGTAVEEHNFQLATQDEYTVTGLIDQGNNELSIAVKNWALANSDQTTNPAGLLYKLVIEGEVTTDSDCATPYVPPVVDVCPNLPDNQATVPQGYVLDDQDQCVPVVPPVCPIGDNLLLNGSFEQDHGLTDGNWGIFNPVNNWSISLSDGLEIWRNMFGGPSDGEQNAELDGNNATKITQTVVTTPGATYELRFDFAARTADATDNSVVVAVDGTPILSTSTANTNWTTYTRTFVADGSSDISFEDVGIAQDPGGTGTLIDNAVLCFVRNGDGDGGDDDDDKDPLYKIYGYVWHDDNRNEDWDGRFSEESEESEEENEDAEDDLSGWTVKIDNGDGDVRTTTTDGNGYYEFNVPEGTWTITEEVEGGWLRTTQESHVVVVPEVPEENESAAATIMSFFIPTAHAQAAPVVVDDEYGEYNFGNDRRGGGGNGSNNNDDDDDDDRDGDVLGATDDREPMVLGEQVSAVPLGAADAGAGSTAPVAVDLFRLAPVAFIRRK